MNRKAQLFLFGLLVVAVLGLGAAVVALRDTDCRTRREKLGEHIERNLRIYRQRCEKVAGLIETRDATTDRNELTRLRLMIMDYQARTRDVVEILKLQLEQYGKLPSPWLFRESSPVDVAAARREIGEP